MLSKRSWLAAILSAAVIGGAQTAVSETKDSLSVVSAWEITSVDPAISGFALQRLQIQENLIDADSEGTLRPGLATEWSPSEDGLTWRFTLRENVSFHDGTPFDAAATISALQRAAGQPGILENAPLGEISADGNAVVITLEKPFAALPSLLAHATTIIPAPASFDADGNPIEAIGTGPFMVEELKLPLGIDLVRFDDYWGDKPTIAEVNYLAVGRAESRALLAESGEADIVFGFDPAGFTRLQSVDSVETRAVPIPRAVMLKVNAGHPFFEAAEARQALSLAIDREGIATGITRFPEAAATQLFPPALGGWHDTSLEPLAYDPEKARELLAGLGWTEGDDGILEKDGERFSIQLRTFPDRPELPLIAAALQDQWREIGVELDVSIASYAEIPAGHQDGSLEVALYARNYGLTPDPIGTILNDFGTGGGDWGSMNWEMPDLAEALETIAETADEAVRKPLIAEATAAIHTGLPLIPITWYMHTVSIAKGLDGVIVDPRQRTYGLERISWAE